jgi:hypothetical protein
VIENKQVITNTLTEFGIEARLARNVEPKSENRYPHLTMGFQECSGTPNLSRIDIKPLIFMQ